MRGTTQLRPGQILRDPRGRIVVLVLSAPAMPGRLRCDGAPMVAGAPVPCGAKPSRAGDRFRAGGRYHDADTGLELRCLRGGPGELTFDGRPIAAVRSSAGLPLERYFHCTTSSSTPGFRSAE
jgi:hypothetical protein